MAAQQRMDQIRNLVDQWEQLVGFTVEVPGWMIFEMADQQTAAGYVTTLYDVGRYMSAHTAPGPYNLVWMDAAFQPWAWYGMSAVEYHTKVESLNDTYLRLTGQNIPDDTLQAVLGQHQGSMTGAQLQTYLLSQANIKNTYGWLKYGLDFQQFQQQKQQMITQFGRELTDAEAVTQLQFLHAAQGPNVSAAVNPTLTQVEKKTAQTGINASVVR